MFNHHRPLRCGLVALALCAASSAFAGIEIGGGLGETTGGGSRDDSDSLIFDFEAGYRFDNHLALHAVYLGEVNGKEAACSLFPLCTDETYTFDTFYGVKGVGYVPLNPSLELVGGAGLGHTTLTHPQVDHPDKHNDEALLSLGLQWRATQSFRVVVEYDYLTTTTLQMLTARAHWEF
jgi:hypothetical protein